MSKKSTHICIIGAGTVGRTVAFSLMLRSIAAKVSIVDINKEKAEGEVMDLSHGIWGTDTGEIEVGDYDSCKTADIIIITAGVSQAPGQTRLDLAQKNIGVLRSIINNLRGLNPDAKVLIVSNPVDILTTIAKKELAIPRNQIFGSGTYLDSARLKRFIAEKVNVSTQSVHSFILGEHGNSSFPAMSVATAAGRKVVDLLSEPQILELTESVREAAYKILEKKGSTQFGIAVAVTEIVEAIVLNKNMIIPVSTFPGEYYEINDVCLGIPAVIGKDGIREIWEIKLDSKESELLQTSAGVIRDNLG